MITQKAARACVVLAVLAFSWAGVSAGTVELVDVAGGSFSVPVTSLKEARYKKTIRQREDFSCGSAAIATLLTYHYQYPISEREVLEAMYARGDQQKIRKEGFSLLDMKRYLETLGFQSNGFHAPLNKLMETTTPAIVLIRENGYNHFVVVKGLTEREVLVGDPATGTRVVPRARFESQWLNKLVFVIHGRGVKGWFNARADWRIRPSAPLGDALSGDSLANVTLSRMGPSDF